MSFFKELGHGRMDVLSFLLFCFAIIEWVSSVDISLAKRFLLDVDSVSCDFESSDICGYTQNRLDNFDWTRNSGQTSTSSTGPLNDHTLGKYKRGHYMYTEASQTRIDDVARLTSQLTLSNGGAKSVSFYYHMYGSGIGTLNVYTTDGRGNLTNPQFTESGDKGKSWHQGCVDVQSSLMFSVVFEAVQGPNGRGDIAIDDIILNTGTCSSNGIAKSGIIAANKTISCAFETSDVCGYTQDRKDDFDWSRHTGYTSTSGTGPKYDHTFGENNKGHYMFIESSYPQSYSDKARLETPAASTGDGNYSVGFYYNMNGYSMGTLNAYVDTGNGAHTPSFQKSGDQGKEWHFACIDLPPHSKFKIIFEGSVSYSDRGDVAIDDVTYQKGICNVRAANLAAIPTIPPALYKSLSCNFDKDMCSYTQDRTSDLDWIRHSGSTPSAGTGPTTDHSGTGHYLYIESSFPAVSGDKARIVSPYVTLGGPNYSISFWYHMYGADMGALNVYLERKNSYDNHASNHGNQDNYYNNQRGNNHYSNQGNYNNNYNNNNYNRNYQTAVFKLSGNQNNTWKHACIDLQGTTDAFKLVFEATRGQSITSDIAIDDIQLMLNTCAMATFVNKTSAIPGVSTTTSQSLSSSPSSSISITTTTTSSTKITTPVSFSTDISLTTTTPSASSSTPTPTAGTWSVWYNVECPVTCGRGTSIRIRQCSSGHVEDCVGNSTEQIACAAKPCPSALNTNKRCSSTPCQNGGTCEELPGTFNCFCPALNTYKHCTSTPCQNGGICEDLPGTFYCFCPALNADKHCTSAPCQNGGICEELPGTFNCFCPRGFVGPTCGEDVDECLYNSTCSSRGSCINTYGNFTCVCLAGFTGLDCSTMI